jgi:hypothetical protein
MFVLLSKLDDSCRSCFYLYYFDFKVIWEREAKQFDEKSYLVEISCRTFMRCKNVFTVLRYVYFIVHCLFVHSKIEHVLREVLEFEETRLLRVESETVFKFPTFGC